MKQGKIFMRVISLILLAGVVGLLAYSAVSSLSSQVTTTTVYEYEAGHGCRAEGLLVRAEEPVGSVWPINVLARADGEKVGVGQLIARGYQTDAARADQEQADALAERLEQLRYGSTTALTVSQTEQLREQLSASITALAVNLNGGGNESRASIASRLKGQTIELYATDEDRALLTQEIADLEARITELRGTISSGSNAVNAGVSGWFSSEVDGYERALTPSMLESLTIAELDAIRPDEVGSTLIGRLCTDETWYFICPVAEQYLEGVDTGNTVSVSFQGVTGGAIHMVVDRIGVDEGGQRLLVLRSRRYLSSVISLRRQQVQLVFSSYSGLRVPKSAIRYEDGETGVYIVESSYARWKRVNILYDTGESYVVEQDKSDTANLWAGDEVIVGRTDLYDGKVVK